MQTGEKSGSFESAGEENAKESTNISATGAHREMTDRREFSLRTILNSLLRPRRRNPRRGDDIDSYHADFFDKELLWPAIGTVLLSGMDAVLTLTAIGNGHAQEANSFMAQLIVSGSASFAGWKLFGTVAGVVILISMANMRVLAGVRAKTILYVLFSAYALLVGYQLLKILSA